MRDRQMVILVELLERQLLRPYLNSVDKLNLKIQAASVHIQMFPMDDQQPQHRQRRREHHQEHRQKQHRLVEHHHHRRNDPIRHVATTKFAICFAESLTESENENLY